MPEKSFALMLSIYIRGMNYLYSEYAQNEIARK
jgi:hypothetical protein